MRMSFQYTFVLHTKSINFLDASISVYVHVLDIINFLDTSISVNVCIIHIIEDTLILVYIFTQTINSKDASISVYVRNVRTVYTSDNYCFKTANPSPPNCFDRLSHIRQIQYPIHPKLNSVFYSFFPRVGKYKLPATTNLNALWGSRKKS